MSLLSLIWMWCGDLPTLRRRIRALLVSDEGLAASEYAVVLALFVSAAMMAIWLFGDRLGSALSMVSELVPDGSDPTARNGLGGNVTLGVTVQPPRSRPLGW